MSRFNKRALASAIAQAFAAPFKPREAAPARRKPVFEPLEPRVLLSAELPVLPPQPLHDEPVLAAPLDFSLQAPGLQIAAGFVEQFQAQLDPSARSPTEPQLVQLGDGWGALDLRTTDAALVLDFSAVTRGLQVQIGADGGVSVDDGHGNRLLAQNVVKLVGGSGGDHVSFSGTGLGAQGLEIDTGGGQDTLDFSALAQGLRYTTHADGTLSISVDDDASGTAVRVTGAVTLLQSQGASRFVEEHAPVVLGSFAGGQFSGDAARLSLAAFAATQAAPWQIVIVDPSLDKVGGLLQDLFGAPSAASTSAAAQAQPGLAAADRPLLPGPMPATTQRLAATEVLVVQLDAGWDGVAQITQLLQAFQGVVAVHVLSHGSAGSLRLGNRTLDNDNLAGAAGLLRAWHRALAPGADLLLYGCSVADGEAGIQFVDRLADLVGADVAASSDATGAAALGGDWVLEASTGVIDVQALAAPSYESLLAPVVVNGAAVKNDVFTINDVTGTKSGLIYGTTTTPYAAADDLTVDGKSGNDSFKFSNASLGHTGPMKLIGGDGKDTVDLSTVSRDMTLRLTSTTGNGSVLVDGKTVTTTGMEVLTAGTGANTLDLSAIDADLMIRITGANKLEVSTLSTGGAARTPTLFFSADKIGSLIGGKKQNVFVVAAGGSLSGSIVGGTGAASTANILSFSKTFTADGASYAAGGTAFATALPPVNFTADTEGTVTTVAGGFKGIHFVVGSPGADTFTGNTSREVAGGDGDDRLTGGDAANPLTGGAGKDTLTGGKGSDTLVGGAGDDSYVFGPDWGADTLTEKVGEGLDTLRFQAVPEGLKFSIGPANGSGITLSRVDDAGAAMAGASLSGAKFVEAIEVQPQKDKAYTYAFSNDWATGLDASANGLRIAHDYAAGVVAADQTATVTLDFHNVTTRLYLSITGTPAANQVEVFAADGNGQKSGKVLLLATGVTHLVGGKVGTTYRFAGTALLSGTISNPATVDADLPNNLLDYADWAGDLVLDGASRTLSNLNGGLAGGFAGIGRLVGSGGADSLTTDVTLVLDGSGGPDSITASDAGAHDFQAGAGNDVLRGNVGKDKLQGGSGDDLLIGNDTVAAATAGDVLSGDAGNDVLKGTELADTLDGGTGNDHLYGGKGSDTLKGGVGNDTYVFDTGFGKDSVEDVPADLQKKPVDGGIDTLDFSAVKLADGQQFTYVMTGGGLKAGVGAAADNTFSVDVTGFLGASTGKVLGDFTAAVTDVVTLADGQLQTIDKIVAGAGNHVFKFGNDWGLSTPYASWGYLQDGRTLTIDTSRVVDPTANDVTWVRVNEALPEGITLGGAVAQVVIAGIDRGHDTLVVAGDLSTALQPGKTFSITGGPEVGGKKNDAVYAVETVTFDAATSTTRIVVKEPLIVDAQGSGADGQVEFNVAALTVAVTVGDDSFKVAGAGALFADGSQARLLKSDFSVIGAALAVKSSTLSGPDKTVTLTGHVLASTPDVKGVATAVTAITSTDALAGTVTLAGNQSANFAAGNTVAVLGATAGDGSFIIKSVQLAGAGAAQTTVVEFTVSPNAVTWGAGAQLARFFDLSAVGAFAASGDQVVLTQAGTDLSGLLADGQQVKIGAATLTVAGAATHNAGTGKTSFGTATSIAAADLAGVGAATSVALVGQIADLSRGNDVFEVAGDHHAAYVAGAMVDVSGSTAGNNKSGAAAYKVVAASFNGATNTTRIQVEQAIEDAFVPATAGTVQRLVEVVAVDTGGDQLVVDGDLRIRFAVGSTLHVDGLAAAADNHDYQVLESSFSAGKTTITVKQAVTSDAFANGKIARVDAIAAVDKNNKSFSVAGDQTAQYKKDAVITVSGAAKNDGAYTLAADSTYDAKTGRTTLTLKPVAVGTTSPIKTNDVAGSLRLKDGTGTALAALHNGNDVIKLRGDWSAYAASLGATPFVFNATKAGGITQALNLTVNQDAAHKPVYFAPSMLEIDFRAVNQELAFAFATDAATGRTSLEVNLVAHPNFPSVLARAGTLGTFLGGLFADNNYDKVVFTDVNPFTTVYGGRDLNTFAIAPGGNFKGKVVGGTGFRSAASSAWDVLAGGVLNFEQILSLNMPPLAVQNKIDYSSGTALALFSSAASWKNIGDGARVPGFTYAFLGDVIGAPRAAGFSGGISGATNIAYGAGLNLLTGTGTPRWDKIAVAFKDVVDGGGVSDDNKARLLQTFFGSSNTFTVAGNLLKPSTGNKYADAVMNSVFSAPFAPGVHLMSGKSGADTYKFAGVWGYAAVVEYPDFKLGVTVPEQYDTLDFSAVSTDLTFKIREVTTENIGALTELYDRLKGAGANGPTVGLSIGSNLILVTDGFVNSVSGQVDVAATPFFNVVVANDIENIVGGQGVNTFQFISEGFGKTPRLQGSISTGVGGQVVLDYSLYDPGDAGSTGVRVNLGAGADWTMPHSGDVIVPGLVSVPTIRFQYGSADLVDGSRFFGIEEILKELGIGSTGTDKIAVSNGKSVTGSSRNDQLTGNTGDNLLISGGGADVLDGGSDSLTQGIEPYKSVDFGNSWSSSNWDFKSSVKRQGDIVSFETSSGAVYLALSDGEAIGNAWAGCPVQRLVVPAAAGDVKLNFGIKDSKEKTAKLIESTAINAASTTAGLTTALNKLVADSKLRGTASVTGSGTAEQPWVISFSDGNLPMLQSTNVDMAVQALGSAVSVSGLPEGFATLSQTIVATGAFDLAARIGTTSTLTWLAAVDSQAAQPLTATALQAAIKLLDPDAHVTGDGSSTKPWLVDFGAGMGLALSAAAVGTGSNATVVNNAVQALAHDQTEATFTLGLGGQTSTELSKASTAEQVQAALRSLTGAAAVTVTGSGKASDPWLVSFAGATADVALLGASTGHVAVKGRHQITAAEGASFSLSLGAAASLSATATAADIAAALSPADSGAVTVSGQGTAANPWLVTWAAASRAPS